MEHRTRNSGYAKRMRMFSPLGCRQWRQLRAHCDARGDYRKFRTILSIARQGCRATNAAPARGPEDARRSGPLARTRDAVDSIPMEMRPLAGDGPTISRVG